MANITGTAGNDKLTGTAGDDIISGLAGNDIIDGGAGNDQMIGGKGNDVYIVDSSKDTITENAGEGIDTVEGFGSLHLSQYDNVENGILLGTGNNAVQGNDDANVLTGNSGNNFFEGFGGNDTLIGGAGNDQYQLDVGDDNDKIVEAANGGIDLVDSRLDHYTLGANLENLTLAFGNGISGTGNALDNQITGNNLDNTLDGGAGNDTLDGGSGADKMSGGLGNDTYLVDNAGDQVIEGVNQGTDTVMTGLDGYTLAANVENLTALGTVGLHLNGNALNNTITGTTGNDTLAGGAGNDQYVLQNVNDVVTEAANEGTDTVILRISGGAYAMTDNVENLIVVGSHGDEDLDAFGNGGDNVITGNAGSNNFSGLDGNDTIFGNAGNDTLNGGFGNDKLDGGDDDDILNGNAGNDILSGDDGQDVLNGGDGTDTLFGGNGNDELSGGAGIDTLQGGAGDDHYELTDAGDAADKVIEGANAGFDTVEIFFATNTAYTLAANVEDLNLFQGATKAVGNALNNTIIGRTSGVSYQLDGGAGNDLVVGNDADDTLSGGTGDDGVRGAGGNDILDGGAGNDSIDGGTGNDKMSGGAGNDVYTVDAAGDQVIESKNQGIDRVNTTLSVYALGDNVENLTFFDGADSTGTGNALDNIIAGAGGNDTLTGGAGNDTLLGGSGTDTLFGGDGDDKLDYRVINGVIDTSQASGADQLHGGKGNDTYLVDNANDQVFENVGEGKDTVFATVSYTLAAGQEVETLTLLGTQSINAIGNEFANTITGNSSNNILTGGGGNDILIGGLGDDTYTLNVGDDGDKIIEAAGGGSDLVISSLKTYTLGANLDRLVLGAGAGDIDGNGNALSNLIDGNEGTNHIHAGDGADDVNGAGGDDQIFGEGGDDRLSGGAGNDFVDGGAGNDKIFGNDGVDTLVGGAGNDVIDGGTGADSMTGGIGNDTYFVDDAGDTVHESANQGTDSIISTVSFDLSVNGINVENLEFETSITVVGTGNALNNAITGGSGDDVLDGQGGNDVISGGIGRDTITGDDGNDQLTGGDGDDQMFGGDGNDTFDYHPNADGTFDPIPPSGADLMVGGKGDDLYFVDNAGDKVVEAVGEGTDTVISIIDYTLGAGQAIEKLTLAGTGAIHGTGNEFANTITGNSNANTLSGGGGNDILIGGAGNDTYILNIGDDQDKIIEAAGAGGGTDTVVSVLKTYTLGANLENLVIAGGAGDADGTGNALANIVLGNQSTNHLHGGDGNDTVDGGEGDDQVFGDNGNDTLFGSDGNDFVDGGAGNDTINGDDGGDTLRGDAGDDVINGGGGADDMTGGLGNDTYIVDDAADVIHENANQGIDTVKSSISFDLSQSGANIENLTLTGKTDAVGTGNALNNIITGGDGNDTLDGGAGNDQLLGGAGDDRLFGGDGDDTLDLQRLANGAILSTPSRGADEMHGGKGNDTYFVENAGDTVFEAVGEGIDTVITAVSYTLMAGQEIENLTLLNFGNIDATGNEFNNVITGNSDFNVLTGGGGNDVLIGGGGNDTYILNVGDEHDKIVETANGGIDQVDVYFATPTAYVLGAGLEILDLRDAATMGLGNALDNQMSGDTKGVSYHLDGGAGNDRLDGNNANDVLIGGTGNDTLIGGQGADQMSGGAGNDFYYVDNADDVVTEAANGGIDTIQASISLTLTANVENLELHGEAADNLEGHGNALNNVITGDAGNNILTGEAGNDVLEGGLGADFLIGGAGNDTFLYQGVSLLNFGNLGGDTIADFESGHDKIDLKSLYTQFGLSHTGDPTAGGHLALVQSGSNTLVIFDPDGAGGIGATTLATVRNSTVKITDILH